MDGLECVDKGIDYISFILVVERRCVELHVRKRTQKKNARLPTTEPAVTYHSKWNIFNDKEFLLF